MTLGADASVPSNGLCIDRPGPNTGLRLPINKKLEQRAVLRFNCRPSARRWSGALPTCVRAFGWGIFIRCLMEAKRWLRRLTFRGSTGTSSSVIRAKATRSTANDLEWVTEFHRHLDKELNERLPGKEHARIYFDQWCFAATDHIEQDLMEAARHSALFLPIISPKYVAPDKYTLKELDAIFEELQRRRNASLSAVVE
jgi:hypothetical protein